MEVKCIAQLDDNNCGVGRSFRAVLRLCLPLQIAFLVEQKSIIVNKQGNSLDLVIKRK